MCVTFWETIAISGNEKAWIYIYARKMQSNRGDLGTDDNCYFKNIYKTKHFLYLYPGFAEEQTIGDGHLTLIEVNMF